MNGVHAPKHAAVDRGNERSYASKKAIVTKTKYVYNRNYNCISSVQCIMQIASWKEKRKRYKIERFRSIAENICGRTEKNRSEKMTNEEIQTVKTMLVHVENEKKNTMRVTEHRNIWWFVVIYHCLLQGSFLYLSFCISLYICLSLYFLSIQFSSMAFDQRTMV